MEEKQEIMELYKEFTYTKENFVNRSFGTNKFYIVIIILLLIVLGVLKEFIVKDGSLTVVAIGLAGFACSLLLWSNQDAYAYLLKIKFSAVIDKMEEKFSFQPCIEELKAIRKNAKDRKTYVFADVQKLFAVVTMMIFLAAAVYDLIQYFIITWNF